VPVVTAQPAQSRLSEYVDVVRRRKLTVVQAMVLIPTLAVVFALREHPRYNASANVLLSRQSLAASLSGIQDPNVYQQADRLAQTEADVAESPTVAQRTLKSLGLKTRTVPGLLGETSITPQTNADLLVFSVTDSVRDLATKLVNEYARQYTIYRRQLDTSAIVAARRDVEQRISQLAAAGQTRSSLYNSLVDKDEQLSTMETLQTGSAVVVRPALGARQVAPRPQRDGLLGLALGIVIGLALAFLWETLDTRVRGGDTIAERLGVPLLARIPRLPKRIRQEDGLSMLDEPTSSSSEAYRMLRANVEFVAEQKGLRTILVTSAVAGEGKSTTAANLAVALARVGKRVVLVDLDFRRPALHRFFNLNGGPGLTHVAIGRARMDEALVRIPLLNGHHTNGNGALRPYTGEERRPAHGALSVLGTGALPPDPGEFVASRGLRRVLSDLAQTADVVLVDAPPLLGIGDTLAASDAVDALLVVGRPDKLRRPMLDEMRRVLDRCAAPALGFVLTAVDVESGYEYGYGKS
jgi:Mrp family chromosome partitioning ATPase